MEQLNKIMQSNTTSKYCNQREPFYFKQIQWYNEKVGTLDMIDGVDCTLCKNKGSIAYADKEHETMVVKECECMAKRKSIRFAKNSGMGELLKHTVKDFAATENWQKEIKQYAIDYVQSNSRDWFCILGQSGAGKTMICSALAKTLINKGIETRYIVWNTFVKEMKANMTNVTDNLYPYQTVEALYIDDLFKGNRNEVDLTIAFDLINYRYNNDLTTIITSELSVDELISIDSAIAGRIKEKSKQYFKVIGKDASKNFRFK